MAEKLGFRSVSFARLELSKGPKETPSKRAIIRNASFSVRAGEIFVIAGPSGSGKSTLLRLANRLLIPTTGTIRLDGLDISELEPTALRRRVGLVQQTPALFLGTILENVLYGPRLAIGGRTQLADSDEAELPMKCLESVGLDDSFLSRRSDQLSEGEMQRVAIARVLANEPEVLLLDEPTASLDPTSTLTVEKHIKRLKDAQEIAILFVTHDVEQAKRVGDRGALLVNGQIVDEGPLPKLFTDPAENETTRAFVNGEL
ncbi:MAG: phosphate ABC transporter ATP-binding protein [Candidatus Coatesbacteria bacterium]|nr:phosphate ABC transporter ATP-binding protein [Candidatus Coatesbacteria bacterium]